MWGCAPPLHVHFYSRRGPGRPRRGKRPQLAQFGADVKSAELRSGGRVRAPAPTCSETGLRCALVTDSGNLLQLPFAPMTFYRRNLPHLQRDNKPHFVTFVTKNRDRKSTRLNSSHLVISYAVFCLKKKNINANHYTA